MNRSFNESSGRATHARGEAHTIRPARPAEAAVLTELAWRSKRHWGYDAAFMAVVAPVLTVTPGMIRDDAVGVLEAGGGIAGFYALGLAPGGTAELDLLFVEPSALGAGHGGRLFAHAERAARAGRRAPPDRGKRPQRGGVLCAYGHGPGRCAGLAGRLRTPPSGARTRPHLKRAAHGRAAPPFS